jgi:hypothetical protein
MHVADINGVEVFNEAIKPELDRCFAGEHVAYGQWFNYPRSGRRYLAVTYSPIFIDDPGPAGAALVVTRDLTAYMQATEGLLQAQAALAHVNRVTTLGILTASIAHEVNQPLAAVVTDASAGLRWLQADPPNLTETRDTLVRIVRNGNRAADVIGRIRAMTRRSPLQMDRLDMNEVIREVIALTRRELERNDIILRTELDYSIPQIVGDKVQLQQVVLNLIMNSIEALRNNAQRELKVKSQTDGTQNVVVSVADAGLAWMPRAGVGSSMRFIRPSRTAREWGWRSRARLLKGMAAGSGRLPTSREGQYSSLPSLASSLRKQTQNTDRSNRLHHSIIGIACFVA